MTKEEKALYDKEYRAKNKDKIRAYQKEWHAANPAKAAAAKRKSDLKRYGLTPEAWEELFNSQGRRCAICSSTETKTNANWHTDHDHTTGAVRGILCRACNHLLGHAEDNTETLSKAIDYLNERRDVLRGADASQPARVL